MTDQPETKSALRSQRLAARAALSPDDIQSARAAIRRHVLAQAERRAWQVVAAYEPLRTEPGSVELLAGLESVGVTVLTPMTLPDLDLDWRQWPDGAALGVDAVVQADAVLAPALAVTRHGVRLGRGGGSYDRALRRVGARTQIAALLYDGEIVSHIPSESWDIPVSAVVTPAGWNDLQWQATVS